MSKKILVISLLLVFCFAFPLFSAEPSPEASDKSQGTLQKVLVKIKSNQSKIKDQYAETTTIITSNMSMPGQTNKGPQKMIQKGKMWTKGEKSKIEMLSPTKQITINDGEQMAIINPETGQKMIQPIKQLNKSQLNNEMDLEKAMEFFNLSVSSQKSKDGKIESYIIKGVPKKQNKFMGKMEFYIDAQQWVPTKILMYGAKNKLMSRSEIEYKRFSIAKGKDEVWIPVKNTSDVNTPMGKMKVEMGFSNIKINEGISDKEFEVE